MRKRLSIATVGALVLAIGLAGGMSPAQAATISVTSTADEDPASANDGDCSLREAVIAANNDAAEDGCSAGSGADLIVVPAGTYTLSVAGIENFALSGDLDLRSAIEIRGAGPGLTTVNAAGNERGFHTPFSASPPAVSISGMTITGGNVPTTGGGAIFNQGAALTVTDVVLTGNVSEFGGGIANDDPASLTMMNSLVADNIASDEDVGGGVDLDGIVSSFTNVTVTGNRAQEGGGLWISGGTSTLNNVTITRNTATNNGLGGGIQVGGATATIRNSILAGNSLIGGAQDPDCDGTLISAGYNLIGDSSGCTFTSASGDKVGSGGAPIDPLLGPLMDNGGQTRTHGLLSGSPAINAGNPAAPGSGGSACAAADQRGVPRAACDMGAYELAFCQTAVVNRVGTPGNDVLNGTTNADGFLAFGGNDTVRGLGGSDRLCLGDGNDTGAGGGGKDRLLGEQGKDRLKGQAGNDRLRGGPGKDTCIGGPGTKDKAACEIERRVP